MQVPAAKRQTAMWAPVLHRDGAGQMWLFYAESHPRCLRNEIRSKGAETIPKRFSVGGNIKAMYQGAAEAI
ncbi:hypothetical protein CYMTET_21864 [Cymbomonas tetramitiformis]|uniref:Uncharacterized protein n=1 Tax=Cymbomonas tetramitiformis TaxID=36881 RepID=A0AAE0G156_9CHLO|nr:hypothetical protein CYMTET_21864 [Cymbomonas tetramitiformis]